MGGACGEGGFVWGHERVRSGIWMPTGTSPRLILDKAQVRGVDDASALLTKVDNLHLPNHMTLYAPVTDNLVGKQKAVHLPARK